MSFLTWYLIWFVLTSIPMLYFWGGRLISDRRDFIDNAGDARVGYMSILIILHIPIVREIGALVVGMMMLYDIICSVIVSALERIG
jgi:hypothetical protein